MRERYALVLRHVHFEDLGSFVCPLEDAGYDFRYSDVAEPDFCGGDPLDPGLLVVLGGPVGAYDDAAYPFVAAEREFIRKRLAAGRPTLGICLGAQFIASALGARVYPTGTKEIGFAPLRLTTTGARGPLRHLAGVPVLHWHGDTYDLPEGAVNLASTALVENQGFAIGRNVLGLQFHAEADTRRGFERWLVGHAAELGAAKLDPARLREAGLSHSSALRSASRAMLGEWLSGLEATA